MGYQAQTLHQFAVLNFGQFSEVWVKASPDADAGSFDIINFRNLSLSPGEMSDENLSDNGGELKVYETLKA
ncbi:MAG: hypothetical protein EOO45_00260 [Flavobacterium sp.]|nr:MAG: hypothetical protein EOO45_00260 [Flavobacterium sp.]